MAVVGERSVTGATENRCVTLIISIKSIYIDTFLVCRNFEM